MLNSLVADLILSLALSCGLMLAAWLVSLWIKNASIVDIVWSAGFTILSFLYYWIADGWLPRKMAITLLIMTWSLRLALHLLRRVMKEHPQEDARYIEMRRSFGKQADGKFFVFFQIQALVLALLAVPICLICENERTAFGVMEICGLIIFLLALLGEWIADRQLARFKKDAANKGEVCQVGLWRFSRHPNYFFEWLVWIGLFVIACDSELGVWTIYCPLLMLFFLLKVSGVPLAEQQSLNSKGDKYRTYQKTTSVFIPWFRKEA